MVESKIWAKDLFLFKYFSSAQPKNLGSQLIRKIDQAELILLSKIKTRAHIFLYFSGGTPCICRQDHFIDNKNLDILGRDYHQGPFLFRGIVGKYRIADSTCLNIMDSYRRLNFCKGCTRIEKSIDLLVLVHR